MSDEVKPYTVSDIESPIWKVMMFDRDRCAATVRALEAERAAHEETRSGRTEWKAWALKLEDCLARAEKAERERDEWKKVAEANMALAESLVSLVSRLASRLSVARAELAALKKAVADQLHYDMKAILSGTPENRLAARVAQLEEALKFQADHYCYEECAYEDGGVPHKDCSACRARAALSASPSDWLAEHDRSIAERQREACAKHLAETFAAADDMDRDDLDAGEVILATPLVTK